MKKTYLAGAALAAIAAFTAPAYADIVIATAGPITGQYASFGEQLKKGAEMAVADINAAGGVNGEKLVLEIGDDACDPAQAKAVAEQFASKGVKFVAGHFCSGSSIPASKVYEEEGIVQISPASTNPKFTDEGGWNTHRVCGRDDIQGALAASTLLKAFNGKKVAIIHDNTPYGKGLADETQKAFNAGGGKETVYEAYTPGEKDYTALVSKLKEAAVDLVYVGGYHTEAGLILRQMRDQGLGAQLVSGDALVTQEYWAITGDAGEGTLMTFSPDPMKSPASAAVVEKFKAAGYNPEGYTLYTYAAIQTWAQAATKAGGADGKKVAEVLRSGMEFDTVLGKFSMDKKGDVSLPAYLWYSWSKGNYGYDDNLNKTMGLVN